MRLIFCLTAIFYGGLALAQDQDQGLIKSVPENKHDSLYYELFKKYKSNDPKLALTYAAKSFQLATLNNNQILELKGANAIGWLKQNMGDLHGALDMHNQALRLAEEYNKPDRAMYSYNNIGIIYDKLDIYDKALENYFKSLELARKLSVLDVEVSTLNNIGVSYGKLQNYTESLNYYKKAHEVEVEHGQDGLNEIYVNIGLTYIDLNEILKAKTVFEDLIAKKNNIEPVILAASLKGMAKCFLLENNTKECLAYAVLGLEVAQKNRLPDQRSDAFLLCASAQLKDKSYRKALASCDSAIAIATSIQSNSNLQRGYELKSSILEYIGDFKGSKEALASSVKYKDIIFNEKFTENFKNIHLKLEKEKSTTIINEKNELLARQSKVSLIAMVTGVFLFILAGVLFYFSRILRKKNKQISMYNTDLEKRVSERTKELMETARKLTVSNQELDAYIYKTSHDIKGPLVTLKGLVELAIVDEMNTKDYVNRLAGVINILNDIVNRVTLISKIGNHTVSWTRVSLEDLFENAILQQIKNENFNSVRIVRNLQVKTIQTDPDILSIAINNIIANAYQYVSSRKEPLLIIESESLEDQVVISIKDNGIGFDPRLREKIFELFVHGEGQTGSGLGLHLSKLAVEKTGGKISLVEDELTHLKIEMPYLTHAFNNTELAIHS